MKKLIIFLVIGLVVGAGLAGGGVYFLVQNGTVKPPEEVEEPPFDLKNSHSLTLEKVQIPLAKTSSKTRYLQADFTIVFKTPEALALAESMQPYIKDAIYGVFEVKTPEELSDVKAREDMKEPVLKAIRELYNDEADRENIFTIMIPSFTVTQ